MSLNLGTRFEVFRNRIMAGEDTHRTDIGTLLERKNHIMSRPIAKGVSGKKKYRAILFKLDLLTTLLEDHKISIDEFDVRYNETHEILWKTLENREGIKTRNGTAENGVGKIRKKFAQKDRLREIHAQRYGV